MNLKIPPSAVVLTRFFQTLIQVLTIVERSGKDDQIANPDPKLVEIHRIVLAAMRDMLS